jgi:hypothetical protein
MGTRLATNSYLLSMNALLLLATYRFLFMLAFPRIRRFSCCMRVQRGVDQGYPQPPVSATQSGNVCAVCLHGDCPAVQRHGCVRRANHTPSRTDTGLPVCHRAINLHSDWALPSPRVLKGDRARAAALLHPRGPSFCAAGAGFNAMFAMLSPGVGLVFQPVIERCRPVDAGGRGRAYPSPSCPAAARAGTSGRRPTGVVPSRATRAPPRVRRSSPT